MSEARDLARRYLSQRAELGDTELYLEHGTAADVRAALAKEPEPEAAFRRPSTPSTRAARPESRSDLPAGAPAPGRPAADIVRIGELDALRDVALGCPRCRLAETRQHVVFGEGDPHARVMVVGEAPGAEEDRTGRPFVGAAGKLLTLMLASVGFRREDVYICNVLKCRPPGNRNPQPDEVEACSPYLIRQVELIRPGAILACGTFAAQTLLSSGEPIGRLRTGRHEYHGVTLVPTYHPAALLRNSGWVRAAWDDLQRLRRAADAAAAA
jgi:uracil-DNA glycosylase